MKFTIGSDTFAEIINRLGAVKDKHVYLGSAVGITAEEDKVSFRLSSATSMGKIFCDAAVREQGEALVEIDLLRRLCKVGGNMVVETTRNGLKAGNGKKVVEVARITNPGGNPFTPFESDGGIPSFTADKAEILDTFSRISLCSEPTGPNTMTRDCINIAFLDGTPRVSAICSSRLATRAVPEWQVDPELNVCIPPCVVKELAKVSKNKLKEQLTVMRTDRLLIFSGADFTYTVFLSDGTFPDIKRHFVPEFDRIFTVSADSLSALTKEYDEFGDKKTPVWFCGTESGVTAAIVTQFGRLYEVVETLGEDAVQTDAAYKFSPAYLTMMMDVFSGQTVDVYAVPNNRRMWMFRSDAGYAGILMAVNTGENETAQIWQIISAI